jgi:hypothetical protein
MNEQNENENEYYKNSAGKTLATGIERVVLK